MGDGEADDYDVKRGVAFLHCRSNRELQKSTYYKERPKKSKIYTTKRLNRFFS